MKRSLYWFRSDLRVEDNQALAEAIDVSDFLVAVFILTPQTWKAHDAAPCKIEFILSHLKSLSAKLFDKGIPLLIRKCPSFSDCPTVIETLCADFNIDALYFNREYPIDERNRDRAVKALLEDRLTLRTFHGNVVFAPGKVLSQQRTPFQIFTPFKKAWLHRAHAEQAWRPIKAPRRVFDIDVQPDDVPDELPEFPKSTIKNLVEIGEAAAAKALKRFCRGSLNDYHKQRDYPAIDGTSQLSPYLAQGVLSSRQCMSAALAACDIPDIDSISRNEGAAVWISELIWRDFYHHIVYFHPDICRHKPYRPKTDQIPWRYDDALLEAWKNGLTGFPIVDAAMRQLLQTGWMHNRLRMVTAMFLSKILLLDWRLGEAHFMSHLIDGDFAANNGGWQWSASTGTDAVPYFRIFNPITQGQRFDPEGDFIRHFCPELSHLDSKTIHNPFALGVKAGELNYPQPIVDYKAMRNKTIALFKAL